MRNLYAAIGLSFAATAAAVLFLSAIGTPPEAPATAPDGSLLQCEVASTPQERSVGLMDRPSLCANCCMLFVFEESGFHSFWMKNTLLPLDIVFLDWNFVVVDAKENFAPCKQEPCPIYVPKAAAKYVIEVNAGEAVKRKIAEGTALKIPLEHLHLKN